MKATQTDRIDELFLTRAEYDAMLPLLSVRAAAYGRATRTWSLHGVRIRFECSDHKDSFVRNRNLTTKWGGGDHRRLRLRAHDRHFTVLTDVMTIPAPSTFLVCRGLTTPVRGAWWRLLQAASSRKVADEFYALMAKGGLRAVAVIPCDAPGLRLLAPAGHNETKPDPAPGTYDAGA